jgi:glyoxylase-like metal-dependent hydrolase (beta-lactamase superfamily II)
MYKLLILSTLFVSLNLKTFAQVFKNDELSITKLEKNMWVVETSDNTTMYIVEGKDKALLIDTGTKCTKLDSIIRLITTKPLTVVVTHAHPDHAGNIRFFKEIWMHPADTILMGNNFRKYYNGKINFIKDGDKFDLGETILEVKHTPGHTPGSIIVLDRANGICYSSDSYGAGQAWLQLKPHIPIKTFIQMCYMMEKLMDNGITKVYCGHYPYMKKAYDKTYITAIRELAEALEKEDFASLNPQPYDQKIGCKNPMIVTKGEASIVYDPECIK